MPVRHLPSSANLDHLKHQATDLLKAHANRDTSAAQRLREFHPRFRPADDAEIFSAPLKLSDAQLAIAREHGFPSWPRLRAHITAPKLANRLDLPHHERIEDPVFRHAVNLLDAGDVPGLRDHLRQHPSLTRQHVVFEGGNYFRNPTLLEFIAENPIRHGKLPSNIVEVARVILDAGVEPAALNETLMLVATGSVVREFQVYEALMNLLCDYGADPNSALQASVLLDEHGASGTLIDRGARITLPVAAGLGRTEDFARLLPASTKEERHLALTMATDFGHLEIVRLLLDSGEDPNRYNPVGGHSHTTPLHQAALRGYKAIVHLLVERGARLDMKDLLWNSTPVGWAHHHGKTEIEDYLRSQAESPEAPK